MSNAKIIFTLNCFLRRNWNPHFTPKYTSLPFNYIFVTLHEFMMVKSKKKEKDFDEFMY